MKKSLSLFILITLVFTLFGCIDKSKAEQIVLDTDGYDISYSRLATIDGFFPNNANEVSQHADLIIIATPTETFSASEISYYGNRIRKCAVTKVIKGNFTQSEISVFEFAKVQNDTIHMETPTPIMTKGYEYIIFCYSDTDGDGIYSIVHNGAYALNTQINNQMGLYKKAIYGDILVDYKQYFYGDDVRIKQNKKPFCTDLLGYTDSTWATIEFANEKYSYFDGNRRDITYYFSGNPEFINTGKKVTLKVSEKETYIREVYKIQDKKYDSDMIFVFTKGKLTPFRILPKTDWEFANKTISGARLHSGTDYYYDIPLDTANKLAKILSENKDEKPVFSGNIPEVVFVADNKLETSVLLYEGAGYLGGRKIGKELEAELLKSREGPLISFNTGNQLLKDVNIVYDTENYFEFTDKNGNVYTNFYSERPAESYFRQTFITESPESYEVITDNLKFSTKIYDADEKPFDDFIRFIMIEDKLIPMQKAPDPENHIYTFYEDITGFYGKDAYSKINDVSISYDSNFENETYLGYNTKAILLEEIKNAPAMTLDVMNEKKIYVTFHINTHIKKTFVFYESHNLLESYKISDKAKSIILQ